jgi:drug/metabolite transporter (DMT)-like permease
VLLAHFLIPEERASAGRVIGVIAAFSGIVILFLGEWGKWEGTQLLGDSVQVGSAFILGAEVVFLKYAVARIDPSRVVLWQMVIGATGFLAYSVGFEGLAGARPGMDSVAAVAYQGMVIGAFCFSVWMWLLRRHAASRVAIFGFVGPLVGVTLSALALGEPFTPALALSAACVAAGIVLANLW